MVAHGAEHAWLEVVEGQLIRKPADVQFGIMIAVRIAAVDEHMVSTESPHVAQLHGLKTLRRKSRSGVIGILRFAMSWLSFAARKWFSAAVTIARRCDGRGWNVSHTKFLSPISKLQPKLNPEICQFSCVQIEIELGSAQNVRKTGG